MRAFVSVNVEDLGLIREIMKIAEFIKDGEKGISLTKEQNMHFTLKFLGEIDDSTRDELINSLSSIKFNRFTIRLRGIGVFPSPDRIRVIWIGSDSQDLVRLAREVDRASASIPSDEEFTPHLTIARVKFVENKRALLERIEARRNVDLGTYSVESFYLMKSDLHPNGPIYTPVKKFQLL
ncbi:MAG: RNA 2',3'-cyclic phosphodiesterase [Nitrososphaeria archaeon]